MRVSRRKLHQGSSQEKINLYNFSPFFDDEKNVDRVGGRLANSPYTIDKKFPFINLKKSPSTELLIQEAHKENFHEGP